MNLLPDITQLLFYLFAGLAVCSALMVIASRNTVQGVLWLVLTFFAAAAVWLLLATEFLALILVLVYVGAVMTLFLFVVMMLNLRREDRAEKLTRYWPIGVTVLLSVTALTVLAVGNGEGLFPGTLAPFAANYSNTADLGSVLYTAYVWPFEIAAVLLLSAIVAAIALAHGKKKPAVDDRRQNPSAQMAVRPEDRIRIMRNVS